MEASAREPDVVLLVVDTLRADRLGCYGYPRDTSPVIDRLAREGAVVEGVMAQSSWTLPSMVSLLTSTYVVGYSDCMPDHAPTLAELLSDEGYVTIGVVANGLLQPSQGFARGFDLYEVAPGMRPPDEARTPYLDAVELMEHVRAALDGMEQELATRPLFLYVHFMDPHTPYVARPQQSRALPREHLPAFADDGWHEQAYRDTYARLWPSWEEELDAMAHSRAEYDAEVRYVDGVIGNLIGGLRIRGRMDETILAIASDHGEGLHDHLALVVPDLEAPMPPRELFQLEHGMKLYEELVGTPLILWGRGVPAGARVPGGAENIDLVPTLLDLVGAPIPAEVAGTSLLPRLHDPLLEPPEELFSWVLQAAAVREPRTGWKLTVPTELGAERGARPKLFHLPSDPMERSDRLEEEPLVALRLQQRLQRWIESTPPAETSRAPASAELLQGLEALGYTDASFLPPDARLEEL